MQLGKKMIHTNFQHYRPINAVRGHGFEVLHCNYNAQCVLCSVRCPCIFSSPGIRYRGIFCVPGIRYMATIIIWPCTRLSCHSIESNTTPWFIFSARWSNWCTVRPGPRRLDFSENKRPKKCFTFEAAYEQKQTASRFNIHYIIKGTTVWTQRHSIVIVAKENSLPKGACQTRKSPHTKESFPKIIFVWSVEKHLFQSNV